MTVLPVHNAPNPQARLAALGEYFDYAFVRNALVVSVLIALCAALLGVVLVLRRFSLIGDGLSHVAFGAATIAATLGIFDLSLTLPVTVIAAVLILKTNGKYRIMGDAAIAMVSAGALAIGYLILDAGGGAANLGGDVCTALFGSSAILSIDTGELIFTASVTAVLAVLITVFYQKIFSISFDERFAKATGTATDAYNLGIAIVTAVVIVIGMKLAGALLMSALIVFPAMSAMRVCKSFKATLLLSALIGVICAVFGVLLSILLETPVGATIAAVDILTYGIFSLIGIRK
ncbi:MAG: metal ABC transporter permease [Clostridia bacterium]|nr:metal ABC transporter permease [Clostridia bacterium]